MKNLNIHSALFLILLLCSSFAVNNKITIFMIGDSTMANKKLDGGNLERGWGQMLPSFLSNDICIENHAHNGRSTKSFINESRWDVVAKKIKKGDYVFIQFGHNDSKPDTARHTEPRGSFNNNLKKIISETRAKGGIPVLFTSIVRRKFDNNGNLEDTHGAYVTEVFEVADETQTILIDLNKLSGDYVKNLGAEKSKEIFVWVEKNKFAFAPDGKQDDTHLNIRGAKIIASIAVEAIKNQIPELSKYILPRYDFCVAQDGSGDFCTIQEAVNAVPDYRKTRTNIRIRKGVYKEKLVIAEGKTNIAFIGEDGVVISGSDYARQLNIFGEEKGTSGSATCYVYGDDFYAENITFENTAGRVGQAVAILVNGDRCVFKNCRFLGNQDTLYTYGKYRKTRQYYDSCYIEGTTDFIFGWATAVFNNCTIRSKANSYITAASTYPETEFGYVFYRCKLIADDDVTKVYLGRPWRDYAQTVFIECEMGAHILPEGWHNWNKAEAEKKSFYGEYKNFGVGANTSRRADWSHQLTDEQAKKHTIQNVLKGDDGWNPQTN